MAELGAEAEAVDLQKEALISKLASCLQEGPERDKKLAVLRRLPVDLIDELGAYLQAAQKEENYYALQKGRQAEKLDDAQVARGKLFEFLVEAENPQFETPVAEEIVALMHDPGRFNLEDFFRNV